MQINEVEPPVLFSLIVATYGRLVEVELLFISLLQQDIGLDKFEVILVDQNEANGLLEVVERYSNDLDIKHIKSERKGLSYNRNIGMAVAAGAYICFPDDDCTYYPDTLSTAYKHLEKKHVSVVFGAIRDRDTGENIIRNWPAKNKRLRRYNFFSLYSSITLFSKRNSLMFNEKLGAGCYFGSCEDSEYVYSAIVEVGSCYYFSDLEVWHPKAGIKDFTKEKNKSYGLGFGAFCAIHRYDLFIMALFFMAVGYHLLLSTWSLIKLDLDSSKKRWQAATSRVKGFIEYQMR